MVRKILILLMLLAASYAVADYRWSQDFEECADFKLEMFFNGDSIDQICDLDSGVTGFDTLLNLDSVGFGLFQLKAKYTYSNSGKEISVWADYDNSRGGHDDISISRIYAIDTSGVWTGVSGTVVSIHTSGGQYVQTRTTGSAGYVDFYLTQAGDYIARGSEPPGCPFDTTHFTVDTGLSGTSNDTIFANCTSVPSPAAGVNYVTAYIDIGAGIVDTSGSMVTRDDLELRIMLDGPPDLRIGTSWQLVPRVYRATSNGSGQYMFRLPATTVMTPTGSAKYEMNFIGRSGQPISIGPIFKFVVDTIPDPLNLLEATRVQ
jgi:hypothetical protein